MRTGISLGSVVSREFLVILKSCSELCILNNLSSGPKKYSGSLYIGAQEVRSLVVFSVSQACSKGLFLGVGHTQSHFAGVHGTSQSVHKL